MVGTDPRTIFDTIATLLDDKPSYEAMSRAHNPYGDGKACGRIIGALLLAKKRL